MKITAEQLKRMSVTDLKYLERNISSWIHSRDQQRNMAATALGLGKLTKKTAITPPKTSRFGRVSERHSRALLDCTSASDSLSNTLKGFGSQVIKPTKESRKTIWKYNLLSKKDNVGTLEKKTPSKTTNLKDLVEKLYPTTTPVTPVKTPSTQEPQTHVSRITRVEVPQGISDKVEENNRVSDNNNITKTPEQKAPTVTTVTTPRKFISRAPARTRGLPKPMSLHKIVTLREHRKKCEERVKELELQAVKLRRQKFHTLIPAGH